LQSQLYLLKQLKNLGFKEEILINVYRSMSLSIINYSAPVLIDANKCIENELTWIQRRALKIIGIDQMTAYKKYNIKPIKTQIEDQCKTITEKITENNDHPITKRLLTKNTSSITTRNANKFAPNPANTEKYRNSCLQKCLTTIRNGYSNKYTNPRKTETITIEHQIELEKIKQTHRKPIAISKKKKAIQKKSSKPEKNIKPTQQIPKSELCTICNKWYTARGLKCHITTIHNKPIKQ
jgi:hypothetical protein